MSKRDKKKEVIAELEKHQIHYLTFGNGSHMRLTEYNVDLWPTTETWIDQSTSSIKGKGLNSLLKHIGKIPH